MRERPNWRAGLWLRRHRVRGRRKFIWSIVVARLALPAAVAATALRALAEPWSVRTFLLRLAASLVAALCGGYVGGIVLWDLVVNRGGRGHAPRTARSRSSIPGDRPAAEEDPPARRFEM